MGNWNEVLNEINALQNRLPSPGYPVGQSAFDIVRREKLMALHKHTGRNVIAYYSGWLQKPGIALLLSLNDDDKNGFMTASHKIDKKCGLDLILHTPGGNIAATQSIVYYLQKIFGTNIRAIIPQIAMSAGTILACCCREIVMGHQSSIGPIDPQIRDIPAEGVIQEFRRAFREVKNDPSKIVIWQQVIGQYRPTFLSQCEQAVSWSNKFVREQLETIMFSGQRDAPDKARFAVKGLSSYNKTKAHDRHFHADDCRNLGLKVVQLESDGTLQDLVLSAHHAFSITLSNSAAYKIIENQIGSAFIKQQVQPNIQQLIPQIFPQIVRQTPIPNPNAPPK
jgi:ATP-dependent protease ClpP protease subunit